MVLAIQIHSYQFLMDLLVRDSNWSPLQGSGGSAGPVKIFEFALVILLHFVNSLEQKVEYIRTLSIARLLWTDRFQHTPSMCHNEEMCDLLRSRLVSALQKLPLANTLEAEGQSSKGGSIE